MPRKVLILEDNKANMDALCKILNDLKRDIIIYCAYDLEKAFQISMEHHIHMFLVDIVLDVHNPGDVSGLTFAREIRDISKYKFTPLIFITSLEDPKLYSYSQLHCFGYIEKPFSVAQVRDTILSAFEFPIKEDNDKNVYFRKEGIVYSVCIKDIIYIQCAKRRVRIVCVNDELEVPYRSCEELLKELDSETLVQCSRYNIVNKTHIEKIDYANRFVKMKYVDEPIEIGTIMKAAFKRRMEDG